MEIVERNGRGVDRDRGEILERARRGILFELTDLPVEREGADDRGEVGGRSGDTRADVQVEVDARGDFGCQADVAAHQVPERDLVGSASLHVEPEMGSHDRGITGAVERLDAEEPEPGREAAVGGVGETRQCGAASARTGGERDTRRHEELGRRTVERDVRTVGGVHAGAEGDTPVGERVDAPLDVQRQAFQTEVDAGRRFDHLAEGEGGADVARA